MAGPELGLLFQRHFLAARRLRGMPWAELEQQLTAAPQRSQSSLLLDILHQTVLHPLCVRFPPPASYRRRFLTELIKQHESTAADPLDELYDALAPILNEEESTRCYKSYILPSGEAVTLSESVAIISQGTTGLITWDAALHLAEWAMENPKVFTNRTVLELGSGVGFTGLVICKTCNPKTYVFSDCHHGVLKQLTENIRLNGFTLEPETTNPAQGQEAEGQEYQQPKLLVAELDWGSVTEQQLLALHADVVIAAETDDKSATFKTLMISNRNLSILMRDNIESSCFLEFAHHRIIENSASSKISSWKFLISQLEVFILPPSGEHLIFYILQLAFCSVPNKY
ncbi:protein-lysine N-methyltransferase EEF2KMT isoform X4 [Lagopus muta]|uniref:protein-lysine N-methyltransferase EEF2KMT isoform X4 n=1 Tax=Lagopus muta TaxID=64668 RepID=UPI00209F8BC0|nr:protein-lysine N-methyltransferase EEF2KMT isoform X4 [Lagopus muta]